MSKRRTNQSTPNKRRTNQSTPNKNTPTNKTNQGAERTLQASGKKDYITLASVIAALSVMFLHTNGCFWWMDPTTDMRWAAANTIEALFYFAAPLFFMISGATLMDYNDRCTLGQYFVRRIKKIIPAFVAWNVVALFYDFYYKKTMALTKGANVFSFLFKDGISTVDTMGNPTGTLNFFDGLLNNKFLGIYWFLSSILAVYLILPLFAAVEKDKRRKIFTYFVLVWLVVCKLIPFLCGVLQWKFDWPLQENGVFLDFIVYAVLGYLVSEYEAPTWMRWTIYGLAIVAFLLQWAGTFYYARETGDRFLFKGGRYDKFPSYLYVTGVFLLIKRISGDVMRWKPMRFLVERMAKYTFATYLIHWYLMEMFIDMFHMEWFTNLFHCEAIDNLTIAASLWYRLLTPFLLYAVCMGIAWVLRKIPFVKRIVP